MKNSISLNIGDKIGFTIAGSDIDEQDKTVFFPVIGISTRDGEPAYFYQLPTGETSKAAIRQSDLASHAVQIEAAVLPEMICLSERKSEFFEALRRGENSDLEVYADFEKDAFVVVNRYKNAEYHVCLESHKGQLFGSCECPDFTYRKRICKHLSAVLVDALFNFSARV